MTTRHEKSASGDLTHTPSASQGLHTPANGTYFSSSPRANINGNQDRSRADGYPETTHHLLPQAPIQSQHSNQLPTSFVQSRGQYSQNRDSAQGQNPQIESGMPGYTYNLTELGQIQKQNGQFQTYSQSSTIPLSSQDTESYQQTPSIGSRYLNGTTYQSMEFLNHPAFRDAQIYQQQQLNNIYPSYSNTQMPLSQFQSNLTTQPPSIHYPSSNPIYNPNPNPTISTSKTEYICPMTRFSTDQDPMIFTKEQQTHYNIHTACKILESSDDPLLNQTFKIIKIHMQSLFMTVANLYPSISYHELLHLLYASYFLPEHQYFDPLTVSSDSCLYDPFRYPGHVEEEALRVGLSSMAVMAEQRFPRLSRAVIKGMGELGQDNHNDRHEQGSSEDTSNDQNGDNSENSRNPHNNQDTQNNNDHNTQSIQNTQDHPSAENDSLPLPPSIIPVLSPNHRVPSGPLQNPVDLSRFSGIPRFEQTQNSQNQYPLQQQQQQSSLGLLPSVELTNSNSASSQRNNNTISSRSEPTSLQSPILIQSQGNSKKNQNPQNQPQNGFERLLSGKTVEDSRRQQDSRTAGTTSEPLESLNAFKRVYNFENMENSSIQNQTPVFSSTPELSTSMNDDDSSRFADGSDDNEGLYSSAAANFSESTFQNDNSDATSTTQRRNFVGYLPTPMTLFRKNNDSTPSINNSERERQTGIEESGNSHSSNFNSTYLNNNDSQNGTATFSNTQQSQQQSMQPALSPIQIVNLGNENFRNHSESAFSTSSVGTNNGRQTASNDSVVDRGDLNQHTMDTTNVINTDADTDLNETNYQTSQAQPAFFERELDNAQKIDENSDDHEMSENSVDEKTQKEAGVEENNSFDASVGHQNSDSNFNLSSKNYNHHNNNHQHHGIRVRNSSETLISRGNISNYSFENLNHDLPSPNSVIDKSHSKAFTGGVIGKRQVSGSSTSGSIRSNAVPSLISETSKSSSSTNTLSTASFSTTLNNYTRSGSVPEMSRETDSDSHDKHTDDGGEITTPITVSNQLSENNDSDKPERRFQELDNQQGQSNNHDSNTPSSCHSVLLLPTSPHESFGYIPFSKQQQQQQQPLARNKLSSSDVQSRRASFPKMMSQSSILTPTPSIEPLAFEEGNSLMDVIFGASNKHQGSNNIENKDDADTTTTNDDDNNGYHNNNAHICNNIGISRFARSSSSSSSSPPVTPSSPTFSASSRSSPHNTYNFSKPRATQMVSQPLQRSRASQVMNSSPLPTSSNSMPSQSAVLSSSRASSYENKTGYNSNNNKDDEEITIKSHILESTPSSDTVPSNAHYQKVGKPVERNPIRTTRTEKLTSLEPVSPISTRSCSAGWGSPAALTSTSSSSAHSGSPNSSTFRNAQAAASARRHFTEHSSANTPTLASHGHFLYTGGSGIRSTSNSSTTTTTSNASSSNLDIIRSFSPANPVSQRIRDVVHSLFGSNSGSSNVNHSNTGNGDAHAYGHGVAAGGLGGRPVSSQRVMNRVNSINSVDSTTSINSVQSIPSMGSLNETKSHGKERHEGQKRYGIDRDGDFHMK